MTRMPLLTGTLAKAFAGFLGGATCRDGRSDRGGRRFDSPLQLLPSQAVKGQSLRKVIRPLVIASFPSRVHLTGEVASPDHRLNDDVLGGDLSPASVCGATPGRAPHLVGEDVAGAGFDEVAELVGGPGPLVRPGDRLDPFADFLDRAAAVGLAEVQVQRPGGDQAGDVGRVAVLEASRG